MKKDLLFTVIYRDDSLPPPFKHTYTIEVTNLADGVGVDYKLHYLDRDTIDEEEIFYEGFTKNDDFEWSGKLGLIWKELLTNFIRKNTFLPTGSHFSEFLIYFPQSEDPKMPEDLEGWSYLIQELTQAIFEVSEKEAPLEINFLQIDEGKKVETTAVISFSERSLSFFTNDNGQIRKIKKDWKESKNFMELVYALEYGAEKALSKLPKKNGKYINLGEGVWYELGVSAVNPGKKKDFVSLLYKKFSF